MALYWFFCWLSVNAWKYKFSLLVAQLNKHKESPFQGSFSFYLSHVTKQVAFPVNLLFLYSCKTHRHLLRNLDWPADSAI